MTVNQATDLLAPLIDTAFDELVTEAKVSGLFTGGVLAHEPKSPPPDGYTFACWFWDTTPVAPMSGLSTMSARLHLQGRIYLPFLDSQPDETEKAAAKTSSYVLAQVARNFQANSGGDMFVDLKGAYGVSLRARGGYLSLGGKLFRVVDMDFPFICPDVYREEA